MWLEPCGPARELGVRVVVVVSPRAEPVEPHVDEIAGDDDILGQIGVRDRAEGDAVPGEHRARRVRPPPPITRLERVSDRAAVGRARQRRQKTIDARWVAGEVGRELPEHHAHRSQRRERLEEAPERGLAIAELEAMRDERRALHDRVEAARQCVLPSCGRRGAREAVVRVVDLDRIEALGVVRQAIGEREICRIERAAPVGVDPARGPDPERASGHRRET